MPFKKLPIRSDYTLYTLLKHGCSVTFPNGITLIGEADPDFIRLKSHEDNHNSSLYGMSKWGLWDAIQRLFEYNKEN